LYRGIGTYFTSIRTAVAKYCRTYSLNVELPRTTATVGIGGVYLLSTAEKNNLKLQEIFLFFHKMMLHRRIGAFSRPLSNVLTTYTLRRSLSAGPVSAALEKKIEQGVVRRDEVQTMLATKLDILYETLASSGFFHIHNSKVEEFHNNHLKKNVSLFDQVMNAARRSQQSLKLSHYFNSLSSSPRPRGLYIHGSVGIGKSLLMDMFYHEASTTLSSSSRIKSRRVHFHEFMLDIHDRIHQFKQKHPREDALPYIALELAKEAQLLCFDEFQVTDIADAMILKRLLEFLLNIGVVVVSTSNRPPDALYEGGLNRSLFLPFIETLKETFDIVCMDSMHDYRRDKIEVVEGASKSYFWPNNETTAHAALEEIFGDMEESYEELVPVMMGRQVRVTRANTHCGWFNFRELCHKPLGAADYISLVNRYPIIIVENVPQLGAEYYNEARRFVTLIDASYEAKTRLVIAADVKLKDLFQEFEANAETTDGDEEIIAEGSAQNQKLQKDEIYVSGEGGSSSSNATTMVRTKDGDVEWSGTGRVGVSLAQLSAVKEVVFSFRRAESRLAEMNGNGWSNKDT